MAVGGVAGWLAGYTTMKLGKMAATAIGGTLLILQIAHHKGYIKVGLFNRYIDTWMLYQIFMVSVKEILAAIYIPFPPTGLTN